MKYRSSLTKALRSTIVLTLVACMIGRATGNETVAPEHAIERPVGASLGFQLSTDGRWLALTYIGDRIRPIDIYDLDSPSATRFQPDVELANGEIFQVQRWYVDRPRETTSNDQSCRVWDLESNSGEPVIVLSGMEFGSVKVSDDYHVLAAVTKQSPNKLLIWRLDQANLGRQDAIDLGPVDTLFSRTKVFFGFNDGLVARSGDTLLRWDLEALDSPPIRMDIGPGVRSIAPLQGPQLKWLRALRICNAISWETEQGDAFFSDLPSSNSPQVWKTRGTPYFFDGQFTVERTSREFLLSNINTRESTKLFDVTKGKVFAGAIEQGLRINHMPKSNRLIVNHVCEYVSMVEDTLVDAHTRIVTLDSRNLPAKTLQQVERVAEGECLESFHWGSSERWLVGTSSAGASIWSLGDTIQEPESLFHDDRRLLGYVTGVIGKRWLVTSDLDGKLYYADLNSETRPEAVEFFQSAPLFGRSQIVGDRLVISERRSRRLLVWNASQFDLLADNE